jgi:O-antigen ligase
VLIFLFFQRLDSLYSQRENILTMTYFGLLLTSFIILINFYYGTPFESFRNLSTGKLLTPIALMLSVFFWPALFFLEKKRSMILEKAFFCVILFFSLLKTDCDTAVLNVLLSFLSFIIVFLLGNLALYLAGLSLFAGLLSSPLIAYFFFKENGFIFNKFIYCCSYIDRINIWNRLSEKVLFSPIMGYGFKSSRFLPSDQKEILSYFKLDGKIYSFVSQTIPLHPHNFALELWIEMGFFGVFIFSGLIVLCFSYMIKIKDLKEKSFYFAFFTSVISTMLYSLSMWQTWWIFTIFLGLVLIKLNETKTNLQ